MPLRTEISPAADAEHAHMQDEIDSEDAKSDPSTELCSDDFGSDSADSSEDERDGGALTEQGTISIFDWDDTILPTTWLEAQGLSLDEDSIPTPEVAEQLQQMADMVAHTLSVAKQHGRVVLITNGEDGWVELSCQKFMPSLYEALASVKILSARSTYESSGSTSPFAWKYLAFESEINSFCEASANSRQKNIISCGDSGHEREALIRVTARMPKCHSKALKFAERPGICQLMMQHELISGCFEDIAQYEGNLDISIC